MARPRYPAHQGPLPPPLPHETRPVGQLIAESIRLYGSRFWASLALGLPVAVLDELAFRRSTAVETLLLWACAPLLTAGYVAACALVAGIRLVPRSALV